MFNPDSEPSQGVKVQEAPINETAHNPPPKLADPNKCKLSKQQRYLLQMMKKWDAKGLQIEKNKMKKEQEFMNDSSEEAQKKLFQKGYSLSYQGKVGVNVNKNFQINKIEENRHDEIFSGKTFFDSGSVMPTQFTYEEVKYQLDYLQSVVAGLKIKYKSLEQQVTQQLELVEATRKQMNQSFQSGSIEKFKVYQHIYQTQNKILTQMSKHLGEKRVRISQKQSRISQLKSKLK